MPIIEQSRVFWDTLRILQEAGALEVPWDGTLDGETIELKEDEEE